MARALAPARHQRHRRRAAHESGPRAAFGGSARLHARGRRAAIRISNTISRPGLAASAMCTPRTWWRIWWAPKRRSSSTTMLPPFSLSSTRLRAGAEVDRLARRADRNRRRLPHSRTSWRRAACTCAKSARRIARASADYERAIATAIRACCCASIPRISAWSVSPLIRRSKNWSRSAAGMRLPVYEDLGSGCLVDLAATGIDEPVARASFDAGGFGRQLQRR